VDFNAGDVVVGPGFWWSDVFEGRTLKVFGNMCRVPALSETFVWFATDSLLFLAMAWYCDHVVPSTDGHTQHPLFFLNVFYWFPQLRRPQAAVNSNDSLVSVSNLGKSYSTGFLGFGKPVQALENVSFEVKRGTCLGLLGHNGTSFCDFDVISAPFTHFISGAGKSTLLQCLTGVLPASSGTLKVAGADPAISIDRVRRSIGVCPQHDSLWPQLTVADHLLIFSRIRGRGWGGGWSAAYAEAESAMRDVGLHNAAHLATSECSGGMRRRLSVAISALGNPSVLLLDEPTTGMDPLNRQEAWKVISTVSQGRCVILTSHAMEEVDALCSRVAILAEGQLKAFDAPVKLKQTIGGGGYQLQVTATSAVAIPEIISRLKSVCGGLMFGQSRDCVFWMEMGGGESVVRVLRALDAMKEQSDSASDGHVRVAASEEGSSKTLLPKLQQQHLVQTYDIGTTSLEDVFFRITENSHFEPGKLRESTGEPNSLPASAVPITSHTSPRPFTAVLCKNSTLQMRRVGTNLCQVMTPICVLLLLLLLQRVIVSVSPPDSMLPTAIQTFPSPFNFNVMSLLNQSQVPTVRTHDATCVQSFFTFSDNDQLDSLVGSCSRSSVEGSGFMNFLTPRAPCRLVTEVLNVPFTEPQETHDWHSVWSNLYSNLLALNAKPFKSIESNSDSLNVPDAILQFHELSPQYSLQPRINVTMSINDVVMAIYHRPNNFSRIYGRKAPQFFGQSDVLLLPFARLNMLDFLTSSMQSWALLPSNSSYPPLIPFSTIQGMPYTDFSDLLIAVEAFGLVLYPICISLQLPVYLYLFVNEKETKLKAFASAMGLKKSIFWGSNYLFCLLMYSVVVMAFVMGASLMELRLWTHTPLSILIMMLGGWGLSLVAVAAFIQSFLSNTRTASIVGYSVSLGGAAVGIVVAIGIYFEDDKVMPAIWLIWPQFALTRALFLMDTACTKRLVCFSYQDLLSGEFAGCVWSMYASAAVYSAIAWVLDSASISSSNITSACIEFISKVSGKMLRRKKPSPVESVSQALLSADYLSLIDIVPSHVQHVEDSDVLDECSRVQELMSGLKRPCASALPPLIVSDLRKVYDSRQLIAVDKLNLAVAAGECFGLLGPNGAGKSTTVGLLMGLMPVSSGDALVAGYSVSNKLSDVQQHIGICPQHSVFWETLTALENILFFIRLKGSTHSRSEDVALACDCLHEVCWQRSQCD
jgi:ABC-type multidrug transport system ATPase subunit